MFNLFTTVLTTMLLLVDIQSISPANETDVLSLDGTPSDLPYPTTSMPIVLSESSTFNLLSSFNQEVSNADENDISDDDDFPKQSDVTTTTVSNVIRPTEPVPTTIKPAVDNSKILCPIKILNITISQQLIPASFLALRGVFYNLARLNGTQYFYGKASELLEKEGNVASIAAYFAKRSTRGKEKLLVAYRFLQNSSATPMYSYLLKEKYFNLNVIGGKWTNPAWDCVLNKWVFGWILSVQGIR